MHRGHFVFTSNQHIIVADIAESEKPKIEEFLQTSGIDNGKYTGLRLSSMACVALPTCGLAFAESERYLPHLVTLLEDVMIKSGLKEEAINIRSSGCPNGCSRPFLGEIAFVGRSPGIYNLYLGASFTGNRMNKLYKEALNEEQIVQTLKPIIEQFALEKKQGEKFGDFVIRAGIIKATTCGKDFHDQ